MKKTLLILQLICWMSVLLAQVPTSHFKYDQIFDNREYFTDYAFAQTIFASRLDYSLLFELDSIHHFAAGMNYMYEYGSDILGIAPQLNLYYSYNAESVNMMFGSFPRKKRLNLPMYFLNDTLNYYRPNIEGALISYSKGRSHLSFFIDWTGRVSMKRRETFMLGLDSKFQEKGFYFRPTFLMYHNARSYNSNDTIHLQDNGMMSALIGYEKDFEEKDISLNYSLAFVASYDRRRPDAFSWGRGLVTNMNFSYNIFAVVGVYYFGTPLVFEYGDPFYRSGNYGRIDFWVDPMKHKKVRSKFAWNLHLVPGEGLYHSQQILISIAF